MRKAILILDEIPEACGYCRECKFGIANSRICAPTNMAVPDIYGYENAGRPDWCPLRPMPDRMEENTEYYDCGYADGWNDCLYEILREKI